MARTFDLHQVPPGAEVWLVDGTHWLVWYNTRLSPPRPLAWKVESSEERQALGIGKVTRQLSTADANKTGWTKWGNTRELANTSEDPADQIWAQYESQVKVKPWLADPEMLNLWLMAAYEGRAVTDAEYQGTEWWRTHTEGERSWLSLNASDPSTANRLIADNRLATEALFRQAGIDNASTDLVNLVADQWTQGLWSEIYATNQIRLLADPHLKGQLDPTLKDFREGLDTTRGAEDNVRSMIQTWLGPAFASRYTRESVARWASRLRENPDAELELEEALRAQRLAMFPQYENPNLTYDDIAAPWREVWSGVLGSAPDETHPDFTKVVKMNDLVGAQDFLIGRGLETGNDNVVNSALGGLVRNFSSVRPI